MTDCIRCGGCCDPVTLDDENYQKIKFRAEAAPPPEHMDAHLEAVWLLEHWTLTETVVGGVEMRCDQFDPTTRLCTAHDERPQICRGFPWYQRDPEGANIAGLPRCSFWADLPEDQRPSDWVPVELTGLRA